MADHQAPSSNLAVMLTEPETLESYWGSAAADDLLARSIMMAEKTCPRRPVSSHLFISGALRPDVELSYEVGLVTPEIGLVIVSDSGVPIAQLMVSYPVADSGPLEYQSVTPVVASPSADELPSELETAEDEGWAEFAVGPIESRRLTPYAVVESGESALWSGWLRPRVDMPDDPLYHWAALSMLTAYRPHWAIERRLAGHFRSAIVELVDHVAWYHRPVDVNQWLLVETESEIGNGRHCLSQRRIFTAGGDLVASASWQLRVAITA